MNVNANTISNLMLKTVTENRDRLAIHAENGFPGMTYGDLFDRACRLASFLGENGIEAGKGNRVAISMNRSPAYVAAFIGCLLFGYAAVLLDSKYPEDRKSYILQHSAPQFILDEEKFSQAMECKPVPMQVAPEGNAEAVIVYTSGSTGNPKGIVHSQLSCGLAVARIKNAIGLTPQDNYGVAARFTFAIHCPDLLLPLYCGASLTLIPQNVMRDTKMLAVYLKTHQVTATFMPPSLLRNFKRASDTLKTVVTSGEKVFNVDPKGMRVIAAFGMSECYGLLAEEIRECSENAYLGNTMGDISAYILDENGNETDDGELCVSGVFFSGYLGLPELTRQVLTENPFRDRDGHEKLLHTRDRVKRLPDGRLLYVDRMDWMVKINGNRVELGEVESILRSLPRVRDAIAKGFTDAQGSVFLCAYYITENGEDIDKQVLVKKLAEKVPSYMIPSFFVRMDAFPKNANGKLDRKALAMPDINAFRTDYVPPRNDLEARICQAMERVLGIELVGINDDFFDLGGDSIKSVALLSEMDSQELTFSMIYDARTPTRIARLMAEAGAKTRTLQMAMEERSRPQPLLPYQTYYLDYQMFSPKKIIATNPLYCSLPPEAASPEAVKEALEKVFRHFAVFGTVFEFDRELQLVQRYEPDLIPEIEIRHVSEETFEKEIIPGFIRPFRLLNSILWRCGIFVTPGSTYIMMDIYHAISDRAMIKNMFRNVCFALAGKPLDEDYYYLYLHEQAEQRKNALSHSHEVLKYLAAAKPYSGFPRPDSAANVNENGRFASQTEKTLRELKEAAARYRCSINNLMISAAASALAKYNGGKRVGVRWTYNGRNEEWEKPLMGILTQSITCNLDLEALDTEDKIIQEVRRQAMLGIRYAARSAAFSDLSPGLTERMNIVYQQGKEIPENAPKGTEVKAYFQYHTGSISMFQIMIDELDEDKPLRIVFIYNKGKYRETSVASFAELYNKSIGEFLEK